VSGRSPFSHLIYPLPVPGALGIHVTNDLQGMAKLGPDLICVSEVDYSIDHNIADRFKAACMNFWPSVEHRKVLSSYCGIRPKIAAPGDPNCDFVIQTSTTHGVDALVNLFGIESPTLTAALAIGKHLLNIQ
jgi:L-2-hydroxyglutarate oxidase LhgO